jgi:hypothetical protein
MLRHAASVLLLSFVAISTTVAQNKTATTSAPAGPTNLARNPDFELMAQDNIQSWEPLVVGAPAEMSVDTTEKHGGKQSVRLSAKEVTRSYVHGSPIQVAPGEKLKISAWVKAKDVPADQGTVIAIAAFSRGEGTKVSVAKVGTAKVGPDAPKDWQHIAGTVEVPDDCNTLRLRLGFSYSFGTAWWDDVTVTPESPVVSRIALSGPRVSPAMDGIPVEVLNRDGGKGPMTVRVTLGKEKAEAKLDLTGEPAQSVKVPVKIDARGQMDLTAALYRGETELASEKRKALVPKEPLMLLPPIPTHWVVEDGNPRVAGEVDLAVTKSQLDGGVLTARILDKRGEEKGSWSSEGKAPTDGVNGFSISTGAMEAGDYTLAVELKPRRGEPLRAQRTWSIIPRSKANVTLSADGYPIYDGKQIFPTGVFNGGGKMKEMGAAGFTVSHAYNTVEAETGGRMDDNSALSFLDNSEANGMKAVMLVPRQLVFRENWDGVRRRIRMFRNHPALLAWDEEEGMARGDIKIDVLAKLRQILREEDPNHPLMVGDAKDVIGRIERTRRDFFPLDYMDLGMWWWYPIPLAATKGGALEGDEGKPGTDELVPPSFLVNRATDKPLWCGVQSYKKPKEGNRYPNPVEYRAQAYIAMIHGAKGLMWYGGSVTGGVYLNAEEGNWDYLKKLATEMKEMAPVFMGKTEAAPKFAPETAPISVMLKKAGDRVVLIVANRGAKPVELTFDAPAIKAGSAKVLFENRAVAATSGQLKDAFEPYAVHVYELPRQ